MDVRRLFGNNAEAKAAKFLKEQGLKILESQYRTKFGEIDLIARDGDEIVFVEVKARQSAEFGFPEESVTKSKLKKIALVGAQYLQSSKLLDAPYRIDVVAIEADSKITHLVGVESWQNK